MVFDLIFDLRNYFITMIFVFYKKESYGKDIMFLNVKNG